MAKSTTKSITSPAKSTAKIDTNTRRTIDEKQSKNAIISTAEKSTKSSESTTSAIPGTKSTTRKRKSSSLEDKLQHENKVGTESKSEPKSIISSSSPPPSSSLSAKGQSIGNSKNKSTYENRPTITEKSSEPSKFSPTKRETNERLKSPEIKQTVQSLEEEINERKAEYQSTNTTSGSKSKLSDALDKLFCKQKEKEQQQKQTQLYKHDKRSSQNSEANKSPVDMEIEPKESKAPKSDTINQRVVNPDTCRVPDDNLDIQADQTNECNQHRPSITNKYEQEQFVNNMPKPPTPKSSLIFSPPPTSLSIDKREASIFDFSDNFSIPNDSSVSLLSFNSDNLFKEDSAKETMDLVANLRQNIKKGGKGDECGKAKSESINQALPSIEPAAAPDSTTLDRSIKSSSSGNKSTSLDVKSKTAMVQPTLVIDLDQENSSDERRLIQADVSSNTESSKAISTMDGNETQTPQQTEKVRENMTVTMISSTPPIQLQTEVEQIASKMSNVIPTPADMLMGGEMNENPNMNSFHMQSYACNTLNGNKDAFDRPIQVLVSS